MESTPEFAAALALRERQIAAMHRVSDALFSQSSVDAQVRETLNVSIEVLDADAGSLLLYDTPSDALVFRYVVGPAAPQLMGYAMPASQGLAGRVFRSGEADLAVDVTDEPDFSRAVDARTGYETRSMMTVPVKRTDGPPIGVVQILNGRRRFDEGDLEVLQVLSAQAAAAIEHARLAEKARQAEIVNVLGDVSHDIKNMLTPIQTGIWTLQPLLEELFTHLDGATLDPVTQAAAVRCRDTCDWILESALEAADRVQSRTREIAFAIKGELTPPRFEVADLRKTVEEVVRVLTVVAEDRGVDLRLDAPDEMLPVEFDRHQIYNALYNLVNNAIPETPRGGSVTVRLAPGPDGVHVEVADTGRGIPEMVRATLFTERAITTKPGGTGLGTRIVAAVVQRHQGSITVESMEGMGSVFRIRLPLRQ